MPANLGTLYVQCQRGRGLYNVEVLGRKMDPYAKLQFQGKEHKTKTADNGHKAPEWTGDPTFDFTVSDADNGSPKRILVVEVFEANKVRDDSMIGCNYSFDIAPFLSAASTDQQPAFHSWVNLQTVGGKPGGEVMLKI
ncbi:C2 domain-containing protein, partial [Catenaria anguillulae PL171]